MKKSNWLAVFLVVSLFGLWSCKREQPTARQYGLKVDVAKLESELANSPPEVQSHVALLKHALRYSQLPEAMGELDYLANRPELNQSQKKLVDDLLEQTKQTLTNATPPPSAQ